MGRKLLGRTLAVLLLCLLSLECGVLGGCYSKPAETPEADTPTACFGGTVTECQSGQVMQYATVVCGGSSEVGTFQFSAETDINGRYFFSGVPLGSYRCDTAFSSGSKSTVLHEGENLDVDFEICPPKGNLSVCITNCHDSEAYHLGTLTCRSPGPHGTTLQFSGSLDKCGCTTLVGLPQGPTDCHFSYLGTEDYRYFFIMGDKTVEHNYTVCPALYPVTAYVRDFTICYARGIPRATITCDHRYPQGCAVTDSLGRADLMLTEGEHKCCIEADGWETSCNWTINVLPKTVNNNELLVNLNPLLSTIHGRVHAAYRPQYGVAGATVSCYFNNRHLDGRVDNDPNTCEPLSMTTTTDEHGDFELTHNFRNGPFVCVAEGQNYQKAACNGFSMGGRPQKPLLIGVAPK